MKNALKMVKLDFYTMKSHLYGYLGLITFFIVFGTSSTSSLILCVSAAWFSTLMATNIFAAQDKNGLDRLYGSVSMTAGDVVRGRYIYTFLNYFLSFLAVITMYSVFFLIKGPAPEVSDIMLSLGVSFLLFSVITGLQMPIYFRMGYAKAKTWALMPLMAMMMLFVIPSFVNGAADAADIIKSGGFALAAGGAAVGCVLLLLSCRVSVAFYKINKNS